MDKKIKVLLVPALRGPEIIETENTLKEFQRLVGGYIETVTTGGIVTICDEEGRIKSKPVNRHAPKFVGDIVICGVRDEDFCSLDDDNMERLYDFFNGGRQ